MWPGQYFGRKLFMKECGAENSGKTYFSILAGKKPPTANFSATYLCTVIEIATQNLAWTIFRPEIVMKEYGADILGKCILAENNNSNNFCYTYVNCTAINIVTKNSTRKIFRLKNGHEYGAEN